MRDLNINVTCAHCGELLDTNEASRDDIDNGGQLDLSAIELHPGTSHECFTRRAEQTRKRNLAIDTATSVTD